MESHTCQNCKTNFTIEPEDFVFYEKMKVPVPTFCPDCRVVRRMTWRNERTFHRRTCAATGKQLISAFSEESGIAVYERDYWWSDAWDPKSFGRNYDFSKPFFQQFRELLLSIPLPNLFNSKVVNSTYTNHNGESKNGYMLFACWDNENVMFANKAIDNKDCADLLTARHNELCYELVGSDNNYQCSYLVNSNSCTDSYFLYDCKGCQNCFMSANLRNAQYVFRNEQLSKEEYEARLVNEHIESRTALDHLSQEFAMVQKNAIHKYANIINSQDSTGDNLRNCKNIHESYDCEDVEDCKFNINGLQMKDAYDTYGAGICELMYESIDAGDQTTNFISDIFCWGGHDVLCSYISHHCEHVFGCIGIQKGRYCILNKQYSKEEYEELLPRIRQHMDDMPYIDTKGRAYRYGDFFPTELSPFAYNETIAQEYFPLTESEAGAQGYIYREKEKGGYDITIHVANIPDTIDQVSDGIVNEIIECEVKDKPHSPGAFRITAQELEFYRRMNLPLPKKAPDVRHYERLEKRNTPKLWKRTTEDGVEVMTPFSPDRSEKIYSEKGYQDLVV